MKKTAPKIPFALYSYRAAFRSFGGYSYTVTGVAPAVAYSFNIVTLLLPTGEKNFFSHDVKPFSFLPENSAK